MTNIPKPQRETIGRKPVLSQVGMLVKSGFTVTEKRKRKRKAVKV